MVSMVLGVPFANVPEDFGNFHVHIVEHALGPSILSFVERLSSFRGYFVQSLFTMVHLVCPLFRGLSSFGVSFIRGFTIHAVRSYLPMINESGQTCMYSDNSNPPCAKTYTNARLSCS